MGTPRAGAAGKSVSPAASPAGSHTPTAAATATVPPKVHGEEEEPETAGGGSADSGVASKDGGKA